MTWNKSEFINFIIENKIIGFFKKPLILKSGRESLWYINWRSATEDVYLIDKLTDLILDFIESLNLPSKITTYYGVPEGATKLGVITQYKWAKKHSDLTKGKYILAMGRANPKSHGDPKDMYFLGEPKGNVVVLEDTVTTGDSLLDSIENLLNNNIKVIAVVCLSNRNEKREDGTNIISIIESLKIPFYTMSNAIEILPQAFDILQLDENLRTEIRNYFDKYGISNLD